MAYKTYNISGFQVGEYREVLARTDLPPTPWVLNTQNAISLPSGPATRRPGTVYHAINNNSLYG
jgi:hypothetical protein